MIRSRTTHVCLAAALLAMPAIFAQARAAPIVLEPPLPSVTQGTPDQSFVQYSLGPGGGGNPLPFTELPPNQYFTIIDYNSASVSGSFTHLPRNAQGAYGNGSAYARADLRTGSLHARAFTEALHASGAGDSAQARLGDRIFLSGITALTPITLTMAYDGTIQNTDQGSLASLTLQARPGGASLFTGDAITIMDDGFHSGELSVTIFVNPQNPFFDLIGWLFVNVNDRIQAGPEGPTAIDFSNTATIDLVLPDGITFTSQSGFFLTGPLAAVPEPATAALLAVGMAGIGLRRVRPAPARATQR